MKTGIYIEFNGKKTEHRVLIDTAKGIWKNEGKRVKDLISTELFYKPDENRCYYVFNHSIKGSFEV